MLPAAPASAAFSIGPCQGAGITGGGASFRTTPTTRCGAGPAYSAFCAQFGGVPAGSGVTQYYGNGSGYGRRIMGVRTSGNGLDNTTGSRSRTPLNGERFGASDEGPSNGEIAQINQGTDAVGDEAQVHTIPVAVGAVAVIVNLPAGCTPDPAKVDGIGRLTLTKAELVNVFRRDASADSWDEITGAGSTGCASPITRAVRTDSSGTTTAFKVWLNSLSAPGTFDTGANTTWPDNTNLVRGNTGPGVAAAVSGTDGRIGYVELGEARRTSRRRRRRRHVLGPGSERLERLDRPAKNRRPTAARRRPRDRRELRHGVLRELPTGTDATFKSFAAVSGAEFA
jgi:ABC-type phosphate transport system substrate-binding protein